MLLLTDEDRQYLSRGLLPSARDLRVPDDLRGWSWSRAPLQPTYPVQLAVYEVASQYCATGRDVYLRRTAGIRAGPSQEMRRGSELHDLITKVFVTAKQRLYDRGAEGPEVLSGISENLVGTCERAQEGAMLARYVEQLLIADTARVISAQPLIDADALVARVIPAVFSVRLDGNVVGLSRHLVADAIALPWPIVIDFTFGPIEEFHRLSTVGYGLAYEATYEVPVNAGVVIAFELGHDRVVMTKDFYLLDAELRQWFVESRDERARMLFHELDPGLADHHPATCPYLARCGVKPGADRRRRPLTPQPFAERTGTGRIIAFPGAPATGP